MSEHLDFDTDFLGKSSPIKHGGGSPGPGAPGPQNWSPWFIGGGIMLGLIIIGAAIDSSSPTPSTDAASNSTYSAPNNSGDDVIVGQYRCSSYNSIRASGLKPDVDEATVQAESDALDMRIAALKAQSSRIDNMYVDEYDQDAVDNYNTQVEIYNALKDKLNADIDTYEAKLPHYNSQVDAYNSFLDSNCTRAN